MIDQEKKMNILAMSPHPDDLEIGCGATLVKYAEKGHRVFLYIATNGSAGGNQDVRRKEQEKSGELLGAEEIIWGSYTDTELGVNKETITSIESMILRINPDLIFVNSPDDTHQDHRHLTLNTISASRYIKNVLFYETPTTQNFQPNVYVEINDLLLAKKEEMLLAHHSQVHKTNIADLSIIDVARSAAHFRGVQSRVPYAEAFQSLRLFINI